MDINKNFKLINKTNLKHLHAKGYLYEHSTGAKVLHLNANDQNKVFSIAFKTPPKNETGIAHIMEHCVLAGSQKYPLKDPFNELAKGSLATFLNAVTYPDKTVYPVASCNTKDFLNLMDVYLDAVFFPKIYSRKEVFLQEGWHLHLDKEKDKLTYNGIVYNEMKGAYSDPYDLLYNEMSRLLFPDNIYKNEAGGNPDFIPELSYEEFLEFHKMHYTPSNAFIFFYGDMDIKFCFDMLDIEYLSKFKDIESSKEKNVLEILPQKPFTSPIFAQSHYSVATTEHMSDNYMAVCYSLSHKMTMQEITGFKLLYYILMATPASALYKALTEKNIGEDISGFFSAEILHPRFSISAKNVNVAEQELKDIIDNVFHGIVKKGFDKNFVKACINYIEFQAKEEDYGYQPKGIVYNSVSLSSWLYDNDPFESLRGIIHLMEIKDKCINSNFLEGLLLKYLINNQHRAYIKLVPKLNLDKANAEQLAKRLSNINQNLTKHDKENLLYEYKNLKNYQEHADPQQVLDILPRLSVSDIKTKIEDIPLNIIEENGIKIMHSPLSTNDIIYTTMLFGLSNIPQDLLPCIKILQYLLSKVSTKNYNMQNLTEEIKGNLGGLSFSIDILSKNYKDFKPYAIISSKFLSKNIDKMLEIVEEIINNSIFNDKNLIKNYILELKASIEDMLLTNGTSFAIRRSSSYFSVASLYSELVSGLGFYDYISNILDNFDINFEKLQSELINTARLIYNKNVIFSIVCDNDLYKNIKTPFSNFHSKLNSASSKIEVYNYKFDTKNEGFINASQIQYIALSASFALDNYPYKGQMKVLSSIISNYLYEEIRVKNGAYGCGCGFGQSGNMYLYSYRDPELKKTLDIFKNIPKVIKNLNLDQKEIDKFILGSIKNFDRPISNSHKGAIATSNYLLDITNDMQQTERDEILSTNLDDIKGFHELLSSAIAQNNFCVVGSEEIIEKQKDIFGIIKKV